MKATSVHVSRKLNDITYALDRAQRRDITTMIPFHEPERSAFVVDLLIRSLRRMTPEAREDLQIEVLAFEGDNRHNPAPAIFPTDGADKLRNMTARALLRRTPDEVREIFRRAETEGGVTESK